jgi:glycosyltransferase involved in cell wall biosynthesis
MSSASVAKPTIAYIGCWFNRDMYSHNCSDLINALRKRGADIKVITSNCRCFSSAQRFDIAVDELINSDCSAVKIPHAPADPGKKKHGLFKYLLVKILRLHIWLGAARGILYYKNSRSADVIHYDQVLEAFGVIPLYVLAFLAARKRKRLFVTVHEIDPFQRKHKWMNSLYHRCTQVIVYSENMKREIVALGVDPNRVVVTKYPAVVSDIGAKERSKYVFFGGHSILRGKGYLELLGALRILKARNVPIRLLIYVGHGCNGLEEAREMAQSPDLEGLIEWKDFFTGIELASAYQTCKACVVPYTSGSARHPLTTAMTNGTPVIATHNVDIPEYLGSLGIYIDGSSESIANAICDIENGKTDIRPLGSGLRKKAIDELDVAKVAENLCAIFRERQGRFESA